MMVKLFSDGGVFGSSKDSELDYEGVSFETNDGLTLRGWLIPGSTGNVIIHSHYGAQANRAGWKREGKGMMAMWDKDIESLRQAKYLNKEMGYTVLMYDFRNHEESDKDETTPWVSYGLKDAIDVSATVKFMNDVRLTAQPILDCCSFAWVVKLQLMVRVRQKVEKPRQVKSHG